MRVFFSLTASTQGEVPPSSIVFLEKADISTAKKLCNRQQNSGWIWLQARLKLYISDYEIKAIASICPIVSNTVRQCITHHPNFAEP